MPRPALLVLEDGRSFSGESFGAEGEVFGEAVFATGMTGYQETLTDPSYAGQVVVMTAPHIGNTGMNDEDLESERVWVSGFVVRDAARRTSSWRSQRTLAEDLEAQGVVGISQIDTRALTRHLRERGVMRVGVSTIETDPEALRRRVLDSPPMAGRDLSAEVTTPEPYVVPATSTPGDHGVSAPAGPTTPPSGDHGVSAPGRKPHDHRGGEPHRGGERLRGSEPRGRVVALDLGIKAATPRALAGRGYDVHVLPATATVEDVLALEPDGFFVSNGPGDPATAEGPIALLRAMLERRVPTFGICFGNQLLGRALGLETYKLAYGHRGINSPVLDRATGRVEVTAHNHGFAIDAPLDGPFDTPYGRAEVSHLCLNDNVVEGLRCLDVPAFSVQYHPEAAAGPHDAEHHFDRFASLMAAKS